VAARLCRYEHIFAAACPHESNRRLGSQATAPRDITTDVEDLFAGVGAVEQAAHGCREIENRTALYVNEVGDLASASQIKKQYRQRLKAVSRRRFERIQPVISAGRTQAEHGLIIRWSWVRAAHAREWRAGPPSKEGPLRCRPVLGQARGVKSRGSYGLRWTDVDVEAQTISIESTRVVVDGVVVEGGTRSETSTRVFAAHPRAVGSAQRRRAHAGRGAARRGRPASAAASWSSTLWAGATTPTRGRTTGRPRVRRRASSASGYTTPATPAAH